MPTYSIRLSLLELFQSTAIGSFIGGYPLTPENFNLPFCKHCQKPMTFYMQIQFPNDHAWALKTLSIFSCTHTEENEFPEMSSDLLNLPDYFLDTYQKHFQFFVFSESEILHINYQYQPIIKFLPLEIKKINNRRYKKSKIGELPNWTLGDDTPQSYMGSRLTFLFQLESDFVFPRLPFAEKQVVRKFMYQQSGFIENYQLFSGLPLFFFGTLDLQEPKVYVLNHK
jgi:hypothetical protein